MRNYTEGILSDVFDMITQPPKISSSVTTRTIEDYLDPYTMEQLFDGVVYRLRKQSKNKLAREAIELFFLEHRGASQFENTIDPQLIRLYKHKLEDVIINFVTVDALDIINQVQQYLKKQDPTYDISQITGDQYFGSILKQVDSQKYDIIDNISKLYQEFKKEKQKKSWQIDSGSKSNRSARNMNARNSEKLDNAFSKFVRKVQKYDSSLSEEQILDNLEFLLSNDEYPAKAVSKMKPGGGD